MAVPIEKQLDALEERARDITRRKAAFANEIADEMDEIAGEYARLGREVFEGKPWLLEPLTRAVEGMRSDAAEMRKVGRG